MSDETAGGGVEPVVIPYKPFPSFAEWNRVPFDGTVFDGFELQLSEARAAVTAEVFSSVVERATRSAAVDTGALEGIFETDRGFTYSVAVGAAVLDSIKSLKGERAARAIEDALAAYEFVLSAATRADHITEVWIRELHAVICKSQAKYTVITAIGQQEQDLPKGEYKTQANNPLHFGTNEIHSYAPVLDTGPEMQRLINELRSQEFETAHPVMQAAYAHYAFVCVHPFADGNGRVSRALASVFLYRRPGVPLVIYADQKVPYLDSLEAGDAGDYRRFISFVNFRVIDSLATARQDLRAAAAPTIAQQLDAIAALQTGRAGLPHAELDNVAGYLMESLRTAFADEATDAMSTPPLSMSLTLQRGDVGLAAPTGYRQIIQSATWLDVNLNSAAPATAAARRIYRTVVARPDTDGPDFLVMQGERVVVEAFVHDVSPTLSESLAHRQHRLAEAELSEMLAEIIAKATDSLRNTGYGL